MFDVRSRRRATLAAGAALLAAFGWFSLSAAAHAASPTAGEGQSVTLFAAASTTEAIDAIRQEFTQRTGVGVATSFASSSTLAQQVEMGAEADVFLSANIRWVDYLEKKGLISRRCNLLTNRLVVVVPSRSKLKLTQLDDLASPAIEHVALGETQSVPAGIYARQALEKLNVWPRVQNKVVAANDVRHALSFVETSAAEAGIVYATDAAASTQVKVAFEIPSQWTEPVVYAMALLKPAEGKPAALALYEELRSPAAAAIFTKHGFSPYEEAKPDSEKTPAGQRKEASSTNAAAPATPAAVTP